MSSLAFRSISEFAIAAGPGQGGTKSLTEIYKGRIRRYNKELNAVCYVAGDTDGENEEVSRDDWNSRDTRRDTLKGVACTIKDAIDVRGMPSTWGIERLRENRPQKDAGVVKRLRDAGAIILGKTNVPPFTADHQTGNSLFGVTRNPWDLGRTPGGSSGGAAAAVAAGLSAFDIGTDIAGSIRLPANYCGIWGHKASFGALPTDGVQMPGETVGPDMCVIGPLARSAKDLELLMRILAGPTGSLNSEDALISLARLRDREWRDWRLGVISDDYDFPVTEEVRSSLLGLAADLRRRGALVDELTLDRGEAAKLYALFVQLLRSATHLELTEEELAQRIMGMQADLESRTFNRDYLNYALAGCTLTHREWLKLMGSREEFMQSWRRRLTDYDLILMPATVSVAPLLAKNCARADRAYSIGTHRYPLTNNLLWLGIANLFHCPSTAIPTGRTESGLPIGAQLLGLPGSDWKTILFAEKLEHIGYTYEAPENYLMD